MLLMKNLHALGKNPMNHSIDRRTFLQGSAALLTTSSLASARQPGEDSLPIIDTHQHLWDLNKFTLPWLENNPALRKSFLMEDYSKAIGELTGVKVVKAIYMEVDVAPEQQQAEADWIMAVCKSKQTPTVAAVISGRPNADSFPGYIKPFKDNPYIKGIRQVLHGAGTPAGYCLDPKFTAGIRLLGELGLSFDLCMRPGELLDGAKLADACPDTRFILDHCGNGDVRAKDRNQWQKDIAEVAKRKNVVCCKISGIVAAATPGQWSADDLAPIVKHTLDVFGPDRVVFGGDWPVCTLAATYKQWVDALRTILRGRSAQEQRKLFYENSERLYRLG